MMIDYPKICEDIFEELSSRKREVLEKRFGLITDTAFTLQAIGDDIGITRERVRQIENDAFTQLRATQKDKLEKAFQYFLDYFKEQGGLREESRLLEDLGRDKFKNHVLLLLNLGDNFSKFRETEDLYSFWTNESDSIKQAKSVIKNIVQEFKQNNSPLEINEVGERIAFNLKTPILVSYIDISKVIFQSPFGSYGLAQWPEINPRGLKDQAYLVLKREDKPLHFTEIAKLISKLPSVSRNILPESVHNEVIRNDRFVLVGRGIYALKKWGYESGTVKEIIVSILKKAKKSLSKKEIIKKVLEQRQVKESTIALNLQDKKIFEKDKKGKYSLLKK
ncbi:MAG: sigma factor-like helix-turn-helix DNA-binding protein [Patescibacteria group bacterium]|nr:sigma factor-like helix-turn-helix DNA-binding protein [Patescibacteria group bacterium]